jgi:uncharacterized secreted protein with C-terminal beta-propeller domain
VVAIVIGAQDLMVLVENGGQQEINMSNYNDFYIDVKGSDGNLYIVGRDTVEFSLIVNRARVDRDYLNYDIPNRLVEDFIQKAKKTFGEPKEEVYSILDALTSATINNHFEYLKLLKELTPKFEKLLQ